MQHKETSTEQNLGFILPIISGKVSMAINRLMSRNFRKKGLDITPEQWTVLAYLWQRDGVSQQHLCDVTFKDKPSMTRLIDNLEKQHYVQRQSAPNDKRSNLIYLTPKGNQIKDQANQATLEIIDLALKDITNDEFTYFRKMLHGILINIQEALEA